jgi:N-acetylmuramoyl-L-alanine amidase
MGFNNSLFAFFGTKVQDIILVILKKVFRKYSRAFCLTQNIEVFFPEWMNARGWSAYTSKGKTKADKLATFLYEEAEKNFISQRIRKDNSDDDPDWEENFYILSKTKCPAVLTENFFQDNKDDVLYLCSEEGKQAIVKTHVEAITRYIQKYGKMV